MHAVHRNVTWFVQTNTALRLSSYGVTTASRCRNGVGHARCMTRYVVPVLGVLLVAIGAVWTLQGANLLGGSFMSGSRLWLLIGLVALVSGGALLVRAVRAHR
jgi:hypothetical protein